MVNNHEILVGFGPAHGDGLPDLGEIGQIVLAAGPAQVLHPQGGDVEGDIGELRPVGEGPQPIDGRRFPARSS